MISYGRFLISLQLLGILVANGLSQYTHTRSHHHAGRNSDKGTNLPVREECPPGSRRYKSSCFELIETPASYFIAESKCAAKKGRLATPKDLGTQTFLKEQAQRTGNSYWIGLRERFGVWTFTDNVILSHFTQWAQHEPGGAPDEDCVLIASGIQWKWVTTQCHWGYRYVCQIDVCDVRDLEANQLRYSITDLQQRERKDGVLAVQIGETVTVECVPGRVLSGPTNLTCQPGGSWDNDISRCESGCGFPVNLPAHLTIKDPKPSYKVGEKLPMDCKYREYHIPANSEFPTCLPAGVWSDRWPQCIPNRPPPSGPRQDQGPPPTKDVPIVGPLPCVTTRAKPRSLSRDYPEVEMKSMKVGEPYTLKCNDSGTDMAASPPKTWPMMPVGRIVNQKWDWIWMKGQKILEANDRSIPHVEVFGNDTLHISRMTAAAAGHYTCLGIAVGVGAEEKSIISRSVHITLQKISDCLLQFEIMPQDQVLLEGGYGLLRCHVPDADITWHKDGERVLEDVNHLLLPNGALLVRTLRVWDGGTYICRATNTKIMCRAERTATITVEADLQKICGRSRAVEEALKESDKNDSKWDPLGRAQHGRLVGGHEAPRESHPWMAILIRKTDQGEKFLCGANLISARWLITAAHCFYRFANETDIRSVKAKLGKHDRIDSEPGERILELDRVKIHPGFDKTLKTFDNDLALIRLEDRVLFSRSILPICLPPRGFLNQFYPVRSGHSVGTVSGWGRLQEDGIQPRFLHQVRLPLVEESACRSSTEHPVTRNMFCAGYAQAVGDSCQGDSGGPFEMRHHDRIFLTGLVSWGEGCAQPGKYGFYTKLENYVDFILSLIREDDEY